MQLDRRLMLSLLGCVAVVSILFAAYQAEAEVHALRSEVQRQAQVLAESQRRAAALAIESGFPGDAQAVVDQLKSHGRTAGLAIYSIQGQPLAFTAGMTPRPQGTPDAVSGALRQGRGHGESLSMNGRSMYIFALPLKDNGRQLGAIAVFDEIAFVAAPVWRHALTSVAQTLLIVAITLLLVQWSLKRPLRHMAQWLRDLRTGKTPAGAQPPSEGIFQPLTHEVTRLATSLHEARAAAEEEARLRDAALSWWTAERLRISMQAKLQGSRLFAVSNREPYEHVRQGGSIAWKVPP
ncbi:MAG TPA: hypothetical protein VMU80_25750, partial [Bryobacteraceae bacterium]|nr:hypothetical protein [Bryobacteraceae bacterium]